ncbi:MAG: MarR family transcriptional regulator [Pseudomonadota bacterium]
MAKEIQLAHQFDQIMRRMDALLARELTRIDSEHVGRLGCFLLIHIASVEPAPMQTLVDLVGRDNSQLTRAVRSLESKGLVERRVSARDRRVCHVMLTRRGHDHVTQIQHVLSSVIDEILAPLARDDREKIRNILQTV